jgi:RimJ/RimL family protein N-acetyltransferase
MSSTDLALMELHVEALYRHTPEGRLLETREPEPVRAPRFFLGRTRRGNLWRFRHDLPESLVRGLDALAAAEPVLPPPGAREAGGSLRSYPREPAVLARFRELLQEHEAIRHTSAGPAYFFPEELPVPAQVVRLTDENTDLLVDEFAWLRTERAPSEPAVAVVVDEQAVSVSFSSRVTARAAEAGVDTLAAFRGRGYASRVVAAWALAVRETGRVPLYSTSWDNLASQGVARRLGLQLYGVDLSLR